jgi:glycosyltransferase involved in cell wall biosynthesis
MKGKILFYSDCYFFAGCENMLSVLFNNEKIRGNFELSFSYGYSKEYEEGLNNRVKTYIKKYPINTYLHWNRYESKGPRFLLSIFNRLLKYIFFISNIFKIYQIIKGEDPDIIHINNGGYPGAYSCSAAVFAAKLAGKDKIIYVVNNVAVPRSSIIRKLDFWIDRFVSRNVSKFVTGSSYAGERLKSVLKFNDAQYLRIPNTILPRTNDESRDETRKRFGVGIDDILIGNVALFEERKGQKYLIEAFNELAREFGEELNLKLVLEGNGSTKSEVMQLVKNYDLNSKVLFVEEENIYNLYSCLDLFVLPSIAYEDFPITILEVMSLGKPVIGTNVAGIPEQIENNCSGYIVEPRNVGQLKDAMKKIVTNKDLMEQMGKRSREIFEANFKENMIIDKYINLYDSLLSVRR